MVYNTIKVRFCVTRDKSEDLKTQNKIKGRLFS